MEIKQFKIRCSGIGNIMSNPRNKTDILSETTKKYCKDWLKGQVYGRIKEVKSKYIDKGIIMEDNSIDFLSEMLDFGLMIKNIDFFENDFLIGTPDIITNTHIIDVKNSWDCFTFPLFDSEIENRDYYYQLQGYMELTGRKKAILAYVISDTPDHLIEREAKWYCINNGFETLDIDIYNDFHKKMNYSDINPLLKIKTFEIDYNIETIEQIKLRVLQCQDYINDLTSTLPI